MSSVLRRCRLATSAEGKGWLLEPSVFGSDCPEPEPAADQDHRDDDAQHASIHHRLVLRVIFLRLLGTLRLLPLLLVNGLLDGIQCSDGSARDSADGRASDLGGLLFRALDRRKLDGFPRRLVLNPALFPESQLCNPRVQVIVAENCYRHLLLLFLGISVGVVKGGSRARHPQRARFLTESGGESWVVDGRAELQRGAVESGRKGGEERCHCAGAEKHEEHGEHR
mmetsp:Transcript_45429/g.107734  ORF Transcript_45429/g.107734 Transcript_45429/m.107734 type:complete len:225 (+) Transcript_45429:171-845(+)|eukprot:CAMPEP_0177709624 /NCGR_PEP_ID=MMETSP0484_2-20121128/10904_1 /TAXON_ID=354590 /ORGANISM="Rhodomonas lens, Strain RHODO" /LENGTH=224 /DNA_ID=CAMNT_0019221257 /DNA_START=226 /DNA_END=900 /DNA_ORIENTATION=+